jgi:hypothetical protein
MWASFAFLRLVSILAFMSIWVLAHDASAQETRTQLLLSALPRVLGECPWDHTGANGQCLPVQIPENAFLDVTGKHWECERGYKRSGDQCVPVEVPAHAFLDYFGHAWECERGYKRSGNQCVEVKAPAHAFLDYSGHDWVCKRGYKRVGVQCVRIGLPAHGHLDYPGHDWECDPGYQRVENTCQAVWARPARPGDQTLAMMPSPEVKQVIRQVQQQLKQAGYDPGPIDGVLGPKTLAALQQYMETQEGAFVQDTPSHPHPRNGKKG